MSGQYENEAATFCAAIRTFAERPEALENFESYLSRHFSAWLKKYADDPENMAAEMRTFAEMEF